MPELTESKFIKKWQVASYQTYTEEVLLFQHDQSYEYVYMFQWVNREPTLEGKEEVAQPYESSEGKLIAPRK